MPQASSQPWYQAPTIPQLGIASRPVQVAQHNELEQANARTQIAYGQLLGFGFNNWQFSFHPERCEGSAQTS